MLPQAEVPFPGIYKNEQDYRENYIALAYLRKYVPTPLIIHLYKKKPERSGIFQAAGLFTVGIMEASLLRHILDNLISELGALQQRSAFH